MLADDIRRVDARHFAATDMKTALLAFLTAALIPLSNSAEPKPLRLGELYHLLDRACVSGDEQSVQILLKAGADPSGIRGYADFLKGVGHAEPMWHLVQAAYGGHAPIVKLLLHAGADPNLACGEGETALTAATRSGHIEVVRLLLTTKIKRDYRAFDETAAEIAERNRRTDILNLLRKSK